MEIPNSHSTYPRYAGMNTVVSRVVKSRNIQLTSTDELACSPAGKPLRLDTHDTCFIPDLLQYILRSESLSPPRSAMHRQPVRRTTLPADVTRRDARVMPRPRPRPRTRPMPCLLRRDLRTTHVADAGIASARIACKGWRGRRDAASGVGLWVAVGVFEVERVAAMGG